MATSNADCELVQTHQATFLLFSCVESCIGPLLMCNLWAAVRQPLVNAGQGQEMSVFLNWIHVVLVCLAALVPPTVQLAPPPSTLLANARLLGYLGTIVQHWLPGLAAGTQAL